MEPDAQTDRRRIQGGEVENVIEHKRRAGVASGAARRARVSHRDYGMARARAQYPGKWSYAALGREHGMTREGARKAVARGWNAECDRLDVERQGRVEALTDKLTGRAS